MTIPMAVMVRFQKWNDVLALPQPDASLKTTTTVWHYARGMALASTGKLAEAQKEYDAVNAAYLRQELRLLQVVEAVREDAGRDEDEQDAGPAEELGQVDLHGAAVDEPAEDDRSTEADDPAHEGLAVALAGGLGGGVEEDRRLEALAPDAEERLTPEHLDGVDLIFVMERVHRNKLSRDFGRYLRGAKVVCLDIPDRYVYMQPELVELLRRRVTPHLR